MFLSICTFDVVTSTHLFRFWSTSNTWGVHLDMHLRFITDLFTWSLNFRRNSRSTHMDRWSNFKDLKKLMTDVVIRFVRDARDLVDNKINFVYRVYKTLSPQWILPITFAHATKPTKGKTTISLHPTISLLKKHTCNVNLLNYVCPNSWPCSLKRFQYWGMPHPQSQIHVPSNSYPMNSSRFSKLYLSLNFFLCSGSILRMMS